MDHDEFFDIMGNIVRRKILSQLTQGPMSMKDLVKEIDVSRQAILKQINDLIEKGLVETNTELLALAVASLGNG